MADMNAHMKF